MSVICNAPSPLDCSFTLAHPPTSGSWTARWEFDDGNVLLVTAPLQVLKSYAAAGNYEVSLEIRDGDDVVTRETTTISVGGVETPLVAVPDILSTSCGTPLDVHSDALLQNDTPPPPNGARFVAAEAPTQGTLSDLGVDGSGVHRYQFSPDQEFVGSAGFDYLISRDSNPPYERGHVRVDVVASPPEARFTVSCQQRTCTVRQTSRSCRRIESYRWNWGDGTPTEDGDLPYPGADASHTYARSGRFTVVHTIVDAAGETGSTERQALANTAPLAFDDTATTYRDTWITLDLLANDTDPDGDALALSDVVFSRPGVEYQQVVVNGVPNLKVLPPDTFVGDLTFTYRVSDGFATSAPATVTLTVKQWGTRPGS
jgi:PKD repeat protein